MAKHKIGDYQIPFDNNGNQMSYPGGYGSRGCNWRDNAIFEDTLKFQYSGRGRSAVTLHFERASGGQVTMFLKDFEAIIPKLHEGTITGKFAFTKRGTNYGTQYLGPLYDDGEDD